MTIQTLRELMGRQIGLPASFDGSITAYGNLTRAQQISLTQAMLAYIREHPGDFGDKQVATANAEGSRDLTLVDEGFDWELFQNEFEANTYDVIARPLVAIGQGVSTSVNLIGTLLPVFALLAVAIFVFPYIKKANTP